MPGEVDELLSRMTNCSSLMRQEKAVFCPDVLDLAGIEIRAQVARAEAAENIVNDLKAIFPGIEPAIILGNLPVFMREHETLTSQNERLEVERDAVRAALQKIGWAESDSSPGPDLRSCIAIARAALTASDALAERDARMRREGMEQAATIIERLGEDYVEWSAGELCDTAVAAIRRSAAAQEGSP